MVKVSALGSSVVCKATWMLRKLRPTSFQASVYMSVNPNSLSTSLKLASGSKYKET